MVKYATLILEDLSSKIEWIERYLLTEGTFGPDNLPCEKINLPDFAKLFKGCEEEFIDLECKLKACPDEFAIIEVKYDEYEEEFCVTAYFFEEEVYWMAVDTLGIGE